VGVGDGVEFDLGKAGIVDGAEDAGEIGLGLAAEHEELNAEGHSADVGEGAGGAQETAGSGGGE
jgi:hypothetical protein